MELAKLKPSLHLLDASEQLAPLAVSGTATVLPSTV